MNQLADYINSIRHYPVMHWETSIRHLKCIHRLRQEIKRRYASKRNKPLRDANLKTIMGIGHQIAEGNLRLVISTAKYYIRLAPQLTTEFIGQGNIGLLNSIDKFDIHRKVRFSTYAVNGIKMAMRDVMYNNNTMSKGINQRVGQFMSARRRLATSGNYDPTDQEITDWMNEFGAPSSRGNWKSKTIGVIRQDKKNQIHASLDAPDRYRKDDNELGDIIMTKTLIDRHNRQANLLDTNLSAKMVWECIEHHAEARDLNVMQRRFVHEDQLNVIGADLGLSRERIRQIESKICARVAMIYKKKRDIRLPLEYLLQPGNRQEALIAISRWYSCPDPPPAPKLLEIYPEIVDRPIAKSQEDSPPMPVVNLTNSSPEPELLLCCP